jgi:hypothetical protein
MLLMAFFNNLLHLIFDSLFSVVPTVDMPPEVMTVFTDLHSYIAVIGHYVPLTVALTCITIVITLWLIFALISIVLQLL